MVIAQQLLVTLKIVHVVTGNSVRRNYMQKKGPG